MSNSEQIFDLAVVGGGINGVGIARDAAGRGLSVYLCEQHDLAGHTSSASTKLIHGGLRYLEHYEFRLVRESLSERALLMRLAPHLISPLTFILPHAPELRPRWLIRAGLFFYDHLASRGPLPASKALRLPGDLPDTPLKSRYSHAFSYADCWVDDARLVVSLALDARERGAVIQSRTRCTRARRSDGLWQIDLDQEHGETTTVRARALVNAAGPWVSSLIEDQLGEKPRSRLRLVKGSHIIVPKLFEGPEAYILQNHDQRIVFAIPYEGDFTLIGTTDQAFSGDRNQVAISPEEIAYLRQAVGHFFDRDLDAAEIVWSYSGVRPLYDDAAGEASKVTRDYVFQLDGGKGEAPLLSIFGGKITTFRRLAEQALGQLKPFFAHMGPGWTDQAALPGGDLPGSDFATFLQQARAKWPFLQPALAQRLARAYGSRMDQVLGGAQSLDELGQDFGAGLYEAELLYLHQHEWAKTGEDVLWRRSKLGLHMTPDQRQGVADWLATHKPNARKPNSPRPNQVA